MVKGVEVALRVQQLITIIVAAFALPVSAVATVAEDAIIWAKNPSPPFHIMNGKLEGYGICDVMTDKIDALLPELSISEVVYPHPRVNKYISEAENLCFPCMIKRPDSGTFTYSDSTTRYPASGVIINKASLEKLELEEGVPVSFARLLSIHTLAFGLPSSRKYPDALQQALNTHLGEPHIIEIAGTEGPLRVLNQIARGRLDYTIDYPSVLKYFSLTADDDSLVFIPTIEMGGAFVDGAIGCTNNPWGKQAIEYINSVLHDLKADPDYRKNQTFWLNTP